MAAVIRRTEAGINDTAVSELFSLPNQEEELLSARNEAVSASLIARSAAEEAGATVVATFTTAQAVAPMLADGGYIKVLVDSTRDNQQTIYLVDQPDPTLLDFDFVGNTYSVGSNVLQLTYIRSVGLNIVPAPATSSSLGLVGDIAVDSTHLYVVIAANTWKRIALESF